MRLSSISAMGFGGIAERVDIDLDADVVIIVGANGYGKTTICDAISWVLSGKHASSEGPRNVYTPSGTTSVELVLRETDRYITISRSLGNPGEINPKKHEWVPTVQIEGQTLRGQAAEQWIRLNLARAEDDQDYESVAAAMVDAMYLRQESLRQFLTGQGDTDRFAAVAEMVGAGRLQDFVAQLDSHKTAWVRAVNKTEAELEPTRARLDDLRTSRTALESEIARAQSPEVLARWQEWSDATHQALPERKAQSASPELTEQSLTSLRKLLVTARSELALRDSTLQTVFAELEIEAPPVPDEAEVSDLQTQIQGAEAHEQAAQKTVERLQRERDRLEEAFRRNQTARDDLASMATILLRHVSDTCAACGQTVDQDDFMHRLNVIVSEAEQPGELEQVELARMGLNEAEESLRNATRERSRLQEQSRRLAEQRAASLATERLRASRLQELSPINGHPLVGESIDLAAGARLIEAEVQTLRRRQSLLTDLEQRSMEFESAASLDSARKRVQRLETEITEADSVLSAKLLDITARRAVGADADHLIRLLKEDAENFVNDRIGALQPLLAQFYAAIDPHPTFRTVQILTRQSYGKHRLAPVLIDEEQGVTVNDPGRTLSTSQANALAVALFLSFNLGFSTNALTSLVLDDPLQNLDDVHLLGLVDLLRKVAPHRQIIVTTHDRTLASLLARKLRPIGTDSRTTFVRFTKWDRNGPGMDQIEIPRVEHPLKLASA